MRTHIDYTLQNKYTNTHNTLRPHVIEADRASLMTSKKRSQKHGAGSWPEDSCSPGEKSAAGQQQPTKRPRLAGFEVSSVGALVDKVGRATASFVGREGSGAEIDQGNPGEGERTYAALIVDDVSPADAGSSVDARDTADTNLSVPPRTTVGGAVDFEQIDAIDPASHVDACDAVDLNLTVDPCRTDVEQVDPVRTASNIDVRDEIGTNLSLDLRATDEAPVDVDPHEQSVHALSEPATRTPDPITFRSLSRNRSQKTPLVAVGNPSLAGKEEAGAAVEGEARQVSDDANVDAEGRHQQHKQSQKRPIMTRKISGKPGREDARGGIGEQERENIASGGGAYESRRPMKSFVAIGKRRGTQDGLLRIADADALRHTLGFLRARDLARFADTSTGARDVAFTHAALEIADRFPTLRLGVLKLPNPLTPPLRMAFRSSSTSSAAAASAPGNGNPGTIPPTVSRSHALGTGNPSCSNYPHSQQQQKYHQGVLVSRGGAPPMRLPLNSPVSPELRSSTIAASARGLGGISGSSGEGVVEGWRRQGRGSWEGAGLARYRGRTLKLALPSLHYLELCGDLLLSQQKTMPRLDLIRELQSRTVLGTSEFLTPQMRAMLVDWMVEVAFQFRLSTVALHAAVSALDVCLSKVSVSRYILQLLGVVCTMIQSQDGGGCKTMSTVDAIDICASQYNPSQVYSTFNIVVSNTQEATSRTVPSTAVEILNRMLSSMGEVSGLTRNLSVAWEKQDEPIKEENVLAGLLIDLSLLDQYMFRFRPGTLAAAGLFFARVTALYYSKEEVWVTPSAVVPKNQREVLRLYEPGVCRPFIPLNPDLEKVPFGAPGLEQFVASQSSEADAVRRCVERLWLLHQDFLSHVACHQSPHPILFRHPGLFKGIKRKFVPLESTRLLAYNRLGVVPTTDLTRMLDKHLPSTIPLIARVPGDKGQVTRLVAPTTAAHSGTFLERK